MGLTKSGMRRSLEKEMLMGEDSEGFSIGSDTPRTLLEKSKIEEDFQRLNEVRQK